MQKQLRQTAQRTLVFSVTFTALALVGLSLAPGLSQAIQANWPDDSNTPQWTTIGHEQNQAAIQPSLELVDRFTPSTLPLSLVGHGWIDTPLIPADGAAPISLGKRLEFHRGDVIEWHESRPSGVQQGFTILKAPRGEGHMLNIVLDVSHGFTAHADGHNADLIKGNSKIDLDQLTVTDGGGRVLRSRITVSDHHILLTINTRRASFPLTLDPIYSHQSYGQLT